MRSVSVWWPTEISAILPLLNTTKFLRIMQVNDEFAQLLSHYAFRQKSFHTSLVDLSQTEEALWNALDKKSCRYDINKSKKLEYDIVVNERCDDALNLM